MTRRKQQRNKKASTEESGSMNQGFNPLLSIFTQQVGVVPATRAYEVTDKDRVAPVILRQLLPFDAFRSGFRITAEDATNDTATSQVGWDRMGIDGTSLFHPVVGMKATIDALSLEAATPMAFTFTERVWPHYDRAFRTSFKSLGTLVTFNEFVAVTCLTIELHSLLTDARNYVALSNPIGNPTWDDISNNYGQSYKLYPKQFLTRLESAAEVASSFPAMSGVVAETSRMKAPFIASSSRGTLSVPIEYTISTTGATKASPSSELQSLLTRIELITAILRGEYADVVASMKRHMPYTLGSLGFMLPVPVIVDPIKSAGVVNMFGAPNNATGNESSHDGGLVYRMNAGDADVGFIDPSADFVPDDTSSTGLEMTKKFHTFNPIGAMMSEVISTTVYIRDEDLTDKEYAMITPHQWGQNFLLSSNATFDGIVVTLINRNLTSMSWQADTLGAHSIDLGGTWHYMPEAFTSSLDVDAVLKWVDAFTSHAMDITIMSQLDSLAQTSAAPVRSPTIDSLVR